VVGVGVTVGTPLQQMHGSEPLLHLGVFEHFGEVRHRKDAQTTLPGARLINTAQRGVLVEKAAFD
jgi:hypothetical protein